MITFFSCGVRSRDPLAAGGGAGAAAAGVAGVGVAAALAVVGASPVEDDVAQEESATVAANAPISGYLVGRKALVFP